MTYSQLREEVELIIAQSETMPVYKIMTAIDTYLEEKAVEVEKESAEPSTYSYYDKQAFAAAYALWEKERELRAEAAAIIRSKE
jgi:hypothetical protein